MFVLGRFSVIKIADLGIHFTPQPHSVHGLQNNFASDEFFHTMTLESMLVLAKKPFVL